jgi:hypothetical protein
MRLILAYIALLHTALPLMADEYRYTGTVVRVIDGDSLIIDVPDWPAPSRPAHVISALNSLNSRKISSSAMCFGVCLFDFLSLRGGHAIRDRGRPQYR